MESSIAEHLVNYGVLGVLVAFVLLALWKVGNYAGAKIITYVERYVASTEKLHDTLEESGRQQQSLCNRHADALEVLGTTLTKQEVIATQSCAHLEKLVACHNGGWAQRINMIEQNNRELQRCKQLTLKVCEATKSLVQREFPNSAEEISRHCDEIERIINEA